MIIRVLDEAERDLVNGSDFYEQQCEGLGDFFLDSIFSDIESLHLYAGVHVRHFGFHRLLAKRFPFAIYYLLEANLITVYAILDCRKNPLFIKERLS